MEKNIKIVVVTIFALLLIFLIFSNIRGIEKANRTLPSKEELDEFNNVQTKSQANSYEVKDIQDKELATIYYNHFKDLVVNNGDIAYNKIKNKSEITKEEFQNFQNDLINNYYSNKVKKYQIINGDKSSTYKIINSNNQTIIFYTDAVLKYEVELFL